MTIEQIQKEILNAYRFELSLRRRENEVNKKMENPKNLDFSLRLAKLLKENNLEQKVDDYIKAQFFALNYMKYLPTMIQISSNNGLERYHKVKDWYRKKIGRELRKKAHKKINKKLNSKENKEWVELLKTNEYEEKIKKENYNTIEGFMICLESTTYYNPASSLCQKCKNKTSCKKILKKKIEPLFLFRHKKIAETTFLKKIKQGKYIL